MRLTITVSHDEIDEKLAEHGDRVASRSPLPNGDEIWDISGPALKTPKTPKKKKRGRNA